MSTDIELAIWVRRCKVLSEENEFLKQKICSIAVLCGEQPSETEQFVKAIEDSGMLDEDKLPWEE